MTVNAYNRGYPSSPGFGSFQKSSSPDPGFPTLYPQPSTPQAGGQASLPVPLPVRPMAGTASRKQINVTALAGVQGPFYASGNVFQYLGSFDATGARNDAASVLVRFNGKGDWIRLTPGMSESGVLIDWFEVDEIFPALGWYPEFRVYHSTGYQDDHKPLDV